MSWNRQRIRTAVLAMLRVILFSALFLLLQQALATLLLRQLPGHGFVLDTAATLLAALGAGWLLLAALEQQRPGALGFALTRAAPRQLLLGTLLGVAGLLIACLVLLASGALRYQRDTGSANAWLTGQLSMLLLLLVPAAAEEALFRGYPFQKLVQGFGPVLATLGASVAFAIAHTHNPGVDGFALINICAAGVMLSVAYLCTRSLWFATGVHVGWNWSMAALLDLPVSGLELYDAPLYEPVERGPAWLSGGAFGPEAGLAGLLGLLLVLAGIIWMTRKTRWLT